MRRFIPALVAFTCLLVCTPAAQAKWGHDNECGVSTYPTDTHCYALTGVATPAYATIGYQDAVYASLPECSNAEAFVSQEEWTAPKSALAGGWIEDGELTGGGYCDNKPHIFFDERSPTQNKIINFEESSLPTYGNQYNYFAISDLPEKNGRWYTYWWIPNEGSTWSLFGAWGGGWSAKSLSEEAGMEISDESKPTYEGKSETALTDTTITPPPGWYNWAGAWAYGEEGSTCIGSLGVPGNISTGAC
jgi:hypothetical protein